MYLDYNNLSDQRQHGAHSKLGTTTQLLLQYEKLLKKVVNGDNTDMIYLDFVKAFDKVDHAILKIKLRRLGIDGPTGRWISEFIENRFQAVKVGNQRSQWKPITVASEKIHGSGICPQLSQHWSPLLHSQLTFTTTFGTYIIYKLGISSETHMTQNIEICDSMFVTSSLKLGISSSFQSFYLNSAKLHQLCDKMDSPYITNNLHVNPCLGGETQQGNVLE